MLHGFQKERFSWVKKISIRSFAGTCISAILMLLRDGASYTFLIYLFLNKKIGVGDFVFYFGAVTGFSAWLGSIVSSANDIVAKSIKISYYRDYFEMKDYFNHGNGCTIPEQNELPVEIEFCNVSYQYPSSKESQYVLKNINIKINKGKKLEIVGQNGAGKTTLIKLLCGFYYPTKGEIKLSNKLTIERLEQRKSGSHLNTFRLDQKTTCLSHGIRDYLKSQAV